MICEKCGLEKTKKVQSNGTVINYCSNCRKISAIIRHAQHKAENPNAPVQHKELICKIHNVEKVIMGSEKHLRCPICKQITREKSRLKHPQKSRAKGIRPPGRPSTKVLFCEKHNCIKEILNSNGYRICVFCSREATRISYFKDHKKSLELNRLKRIRNRATTKQWYKNNKERLITKYRLYYRNNIGRHKVSMKKWRENNPEKARQYCNNWRSLSKNAEGSHTAEQWLEVCANQNYLCNICNQFKKLERDHIIPLSKGGSNYIANIQALCRSCNASKQDKLVESRSIK